MTDEYILGILPEKPAREVIQYADHSGELGPAYLITNSVRVREEPSMTELFDNSTKGKSIWASEVHCSCCRDWFRTKRWSGGIVLQQGEDGSTYTVDPSEEHNDWDHLQLALHDNTVCPLCGENAKLISGKELYGGGRINRIMVWQAMNLKGYTAILYWMVEKVLYQYAEGGLYSYPVAAFVMDEDGRLKKYRHALGNGFGSPIPTAQWKPMERCEQVDEMRYQSWRLGLVRGCLGYMDYSASAWETGEKTGLEAYIKGGGKSPVKYLKVWKRWNSIENLANAGFVRMIDDVIGTDQYYGENSVNVVMKSFADMCDMKAKKPARIMRMDKEVYRQAAEIQNPEIIKRFRKLMEKYQTMRQAGAWEIAMIIGNSELDILLTMPRKPEQVWKYLDKQGLGYSFGLQQIGDMKRMFSDMNPGVEMTPEELFPNNLREAHDRMMYAHEVFRSQEKNVQWQKKFDEILDRFGGMEWTDGDLCVKLPESYADLQREGRVLRHCVGGYADRHTKGEDVIFFIRHYRRPERCYYTLDIRMTGDKPYRVQLHGYGNERHGQNKEYCHRIPQKVKDFCTRWEKEVMMPYWHKNMKVKGEIANG